MFGEKDTSFAVVSPDGFIGRYKLPFYTPIKESNPPEKSMDYRSVDFIQDVNEEHLIVVAGSDGYKANIRIINSKDSVLKNYFPEEGRFTQVRFVKTVRQRISGFIAGNDKGSLNIFSYPFHDVVLDQITAHAGEVTKIIVSPDNRYVFSAGTDGCLFIYAVGE